jgi:hypothetical protein
MGDFDLGLLDDDDYKVSVLRTKMLGIAECFMYRLPKGSKSPYRYVRLVHKQCADVSFSISLLLL